MYGSHLWTFGLLGEPTRLSLDVFLVSQEPMLVGISGKRSSDVLWPEEDRTIASIAKFPVRPGMFSI